MGYLKEKIPDSRVQRMMETLFQRFGGLLLVRRERYGELGSTDGARRRCVISAGNP